MAALEADSRLYTRPLDFLAVPSTDKTSPCKRLTNLSTAITLVQQVRCEVVFVKHIERRRPLGRSHHSHPAQAG
jgi:hypothetical protein